MKDSSFPKRVFTAAFAHETNTFHPANTLEFNFWDKSGCPFPGLDDPRVVIVPGVCTHPKGGGTVDGVACRDAMDRVVDSLRSALPVDGIFLRLHGAMYAEGIGPAESILVREIRAVVGPDVPIACTFDLHGNIPADLSDSGDILVDLKTAPHTDQAETAEHAWRILMDTLLGTVQPVSYIQPIPIILPGEKAMTTAEPFRSLVEQARRLERADAAEYGARILAATLFVGCAWTDSADTGMSVMVTADGSRTAARGAALDLADRIWKVRDEFSFGCETAQLAAGVEMAVQSDSHPVFLTDSGDNVTGAAPGDLPIVLRHMIEHEVGNALVAGIVDSSAVDRCFAAGEGATLDFPAIGASIETRFGPPLKCEGCVLSLVDAPRMAVVQLGNIEIVLTERPTGFTRLSEFERCSTDPAKRKIVAVKQGYLFPELTAIAARHIMLLTPGAGDMCTASLPYVRRQVPAYPFELDTPFLPQA